MAVKTLTEAAADLEAIVHKGGGADEAKDKTSLVDQVAKAAEGFAANISGLLGSTSKPAAAAIAKSDDEDEKDEDEKDEDEAPARQHMKEHDKVRDGKSRRTVDDLMRSRVTESAEMDGLVDASPVIERLVEVVQKSLHALADRADAVTAREERIVRVEKSLGEMAGAIGLLLQSQVGLHKSIEGLPVRPVSPGILGRVDGKEVVISDAKAGEISKDDASFAINKAVREHGLSSKFLAYLDTPGWREHIKDIPSDIAKAVGIPQ